MASADNQWNYIGRYWYLSNCWVFIFYFYILFYILVFHLSFTKLLLGYAFSAKYVNLGGIMRKVTIGNACTYKVVDLLKCWVLHMKSVGRDSMQRRVVKYHLTIQ
jgi:hypothetical protein